MCRKIANLLPAGMLLVAAGCVGIAERTEVSSMSQPAVSATEFAAQFRNPPPASRILRINHGWSGEDAARRDYVAAVQRQGFGGAVTNVGFGNGYVTNPAQWAALRAGIDLMAEAGFDLWLYDEAGYPSGRAGGLVLEGHPEREARALLATSARVEIEVIAAPAGRAEPPVCVLAVPPGTLRLARAFRENAEGGVDPARAVDLPAPSGGTIEWTALPGRWYLLAVSEDRLFEGSQVDLSGVPKHAP